MGVFDIFKGKKEPQIALFVDGPNIIRKRINLNLMEARKKLGEIGNIRIARIYLDQFASDKLIEAMVNNGFEPKITTGDVDVTMAVEATEQIINPEIDYIALMTRDTDFIPVLTKAKQYGKKTIIIAIDTGMSVALKNSGDKIIMLKGRGDVPRPSQKRSPRKN
ncbi:TIGR00288 family NYN domain-containing protein [Candidatus Micrarchaeota archaeon]|nr:TIGR00288 family NYN domain-containing protein [Candidatus Micrarchaeota archaeon]